MEQTDIPMESEAIPKKSSPKKVRIARCLDCTHEWYANNGNDAKPVRCGMCGSRNVKWRDECTDAEVKSEEKPVETDSLQMETQGTGAIQDKPEVSEPKPMETDSLHMETRRTVAKRKKPASKKREIEPAAVDADGYSMESPAVESEVTLESIEKSMPKIPMQAIVLVLGGAALIGIILFLRRKSQERRIAHLQQIQQTKKPSLVEDMLRRNCGISE